MRCFVKLYMVNQEVGHEVSLVSLVTEFVEKLVLPGQRFFLGFLVHIHLVWLCHFRDL
jgi:hypothetical protein